jgi:hypothetical protein
LQQREILFVNLRLHPDNAEIGKPVQFHSRLDHLTAHSHFLDNDSLDRRIDAQRSLRLPTLFQLCDLIFRNVEELQLLPSAGFEPGTARLIQRKDILVLGAVEIR